MAASALALLHQQILNLAHEDVRRHGRRLQVCLPVAWTGREDDVVALLADEYLVGRELVFLGQPHGLTAVGHEDFGGAWHGTDGPPLPLCHIPCVYGAACSIRVSTQAFERIRRIVRNAKPLKFFVFNTQHWFESHPLRQPSLAASRLASARPGLRPGPFCLEASRPDHIGSRESTDCLFGCEKTL